MCRLLTIFALKISNNLLLGPILESSTMTLIGDSESSTAKLILPPKLLPFSAGQKRDDFRQKLCDLETKEREKKLFKMFEKKMFLRF